jgi:hypothetical protein
LYRKTGATAARSHPGQADREEDQRAGVQLGYVSQQLGHSDVATTARHYTRWCGGSEYWEPLVLERGEVPADLLARFGAARVPTESPRKKEGAEVEIR